MSFLIYKNNLCKGYMQFILCLVIVISLVISIFFSPHHKMTPFQIGAMNCEKFPPNEFNSSLENRLARPMYVANSHELSHPVNFHFNLAANFLADTIFIIESKKTRKTIFRAQYQKDFTIQAGLDLLNKDGGDSFKVLLYRKLDQEVCTGELGGIRFWQADKHVYVDFLQHLESDPKTNEPVAFKVRIE